MNSRIFVLGASSWIGYLLVDRLREEQYIVGGTVFKSEASFNDEILIFKSEKSNDSVISFIDDFRPDVIVNLLRGEDENGFRIHQDVIDTCLKFGLHYVYASSILAMDGYDNVELVESLSPKANSPYGKFKAKCEREITGSNISNCILRFSSVQGWVPHKETRNERFLKKLINRKEVVVDRGVYQNRILASQLVEGILDLIRDKIQGVIHFGSEDSSEEFEFLKRQAVKFGFDDQLIKAGIHRNINLVAIPDRIFELYGDKYRTKEKDTLNGLYAIPELRNIEINDVKD